MNRRLQEKLFLQKQGKGVIIIKEKQKKNLKGNENEHGAYVTQAISQPDARQDGTNISLPCEDSVEEAYDWVRHNEK